jgi:methionyl-tRNA formyltransferase
MKVVCLIQPRAPLIYFANAIQENFPLALAVVENPKKSGGLLSKLQRHGFKGSIDVVREKLAERGRTGSAEEDYRRFFGDKWRSIDPTIPALEVTDINSPEVHDRLRELEPDLLLDHGTSIVKDHIIDTAPLALNLHWGLSPYYRGSHCTQWALINWDPYNIGVTIHKLTKQVDGGGVLAQKRAVVGANDTLHSINMQLTALGTTLVIEALGKLSRGETLKYIAQDFSVGYLALRRQWNKYLDKEIEYIETHGLVHTMLQKPSRKASLPIVEL